MRVITLDRNAFQEHAARLADLVAADKSIDRFDVIIGVKRGGSVVCDAFCHFFPKDSFEFRCDVSLQRPSTKLKTGRVNALLKKLPLKLLDVMRMAESVLLSLCGKVRKKSEVVPQIVLPDDLKRVLCKNKRHRILIIDDAIDSGGTLYAVIKSLSDINPSAQIKVAVMTVTTPAPIVDADYSLYHNRTLIRFPWSNDFR